MRGDITLLLINAVFKDLDHILEGMVTNDASDDSALKKNIDELEPPNSTV